MDTLKILFLPRWYPHRYDPMPGLFIQRQAEALTRWHQVVVLYVHPDPDCPGGFEIDFAEENGVTVVRVYYKVPAFSVPGLCHAMRLLNFCRAFRRGLEVLGEFKPDLVHSHVLTRTPLVGYLLSRRFRVPHLISEHWSRYLPENGSYRGWLRKRATRFVVGRASGVIAVSELLKQAMQQCRLDHPNYAVIPNVVDLPAFRQGATGSHPGYKQFIHVSCFDDRAKNISGLLGSLAELGRVRTGFRCLLVGEGPDLERLKSLASELGILERTVFFPGLKEREELEDLYFQSDFTVLSSRYETFGTVIIEGLACGIPVISTAVGIAPEVITDDNGILVPAGDPRALTKAIDRMLDICRSFDRDAVRASVEDRFSSETIGRMLSAFYSTIPDHVNHS